MRLPNLYVGERRRLFSWLLLNGLGQGLLAVAGAWLVKEVFDAVTRAQGMPHPLMFAAFVLAVLGRAWLRRQEQVHAELLGQRYVRAVRSRLFSRLLDADLRQFRLRRKGALLMKFVGDLSALRRWISLGFARLLVSAIAVAMGLAALVWLHWALALGVFLVLASTAGWIFRFSPRLRVHIAEARDRQASLSANVTEKLAGLATVQAFDQRRRERRRLRCLAERTVAASVQKAVAIGTLRGVIDSTSGACIAVVIGVACVLPAGALSPGVLAAAISIVGFLAPRLRDVGRAQEYWLAAQVARRNLSAIGNRAVRLRSPRKALPLVVSDGAIRFDSVTVNGVLEELSASLTPGCKVALSGDNGSGKSTLLGLIGRLYDPDQGRVMIDGQDVRQAELSSLRRQVAYVSADIPLIRGSLEKNICYGVGRAGHDKLERVLSECGLEELVKHRPGGLSARIAEGGANLSQGERVLVALARALLCEPRILLLDEADANLDLRAIRVLNRVVGSFKGTLIMASHRHSSLQLCDTLWHLQDGKVNVVSVPSGRKADRQAWNGPVFAARVKDIRVARG